jgi:hypothetical protein
VERVLLVVERVLLLLLQSSTSSCLCVVKQQLTTSLSWCLPTGFNTPITYFYLAFFVVLLLHRQMRDDEACREKYGKDWDKYCKLVPYKIIPYVVSPILKLQFRETDL